MNIVYSVLCTIITKENYSPKLRSLYQESWLWKQNKTGNEGQKKKFLSRPKAKRTEKQYMFQNTIKQKDAEELSAPDTSFPSVCMWVCMCVGTIVRFFEKEFR